MGHIRSEVKSLSHVVTNYTASGRTEIPNPLKVPSPLIRVRQVGFTISTTLKSRVPNLVGRVDFISSFFWVKDKW